MEAKDEVCKEGKEAMAAMDAFEAEVSGYVDDESEEVDPETHDVVDVNIDGETHTGVVEMVEDYGVQVALRRNAVEGEVDTGDVWASGNKAMATLDNISNVRSVKSDDLHPMNFHVDTHVERL